MAEYGQNIDEEMIDEMIEKFDPEGEWVHDKGVRANDEVWNRGEDDRETRVIPVDKSGAGWQWKWTFQSSLRLSPPPPL